MSFPCRPPPPAAAGTPEPDNVPNVARHVFANIRRVLDGEPIPARDLVSAPFT
jgi:hypothetical protein